jgi:hypothetical protein
MLFCCSALGCDWPEPSNPGIFLYVSSQGANQKRESKLANRCYPLLSSMTISAGTSAAEDGLSFRSPDLQSHTAGIGPACSAGTVSSRSKGRVK